MTDHDVGLAATSAASEHIDSVTCLELTMIIDDTIILPTQIHLFQACDRKVSAASDGVIRLPCYSASLQATRLHSSYED